MKFACRTRRGFTQYLGEKITTAGAGLTARAQIDARVHARVHVYAHAHVYSPYYDSQ
jgi:hypothetical protein